MDYKFFLKWISNIIMDPAKAWETTYSENTATRLIRNSFFFPLIILVSISAFIGSLIFTNSELSAVYSVFEGVKCFILLYFTTYGTTLILREITYPLDLGRDFNISFKIILFSSTPFFLCQILSRSFESLLFVNIIGLYGLYIFWTGAEKLLSPPQHKKMPLLIATTISMIAIYVFLNLVLTMITDKIYFAYFT
jgi:hypothetical protein